jgi:hypothetical protein
MRKALISDRGLMTRKIKTFLVYCPYINGKNIAGEIGISCTMEVPKARGGPKPELVVTAGQREQLESLLTRAPCLQGS